MSPEQHKGAPLDARSDQFSFCVALHEALYGHPPFAGETYGDIAVSVCTGALQPPPAHGPVPRRLYTALVVGLGTDPARRYPDMDALLGELRRFLPRSRSTALRLGLTAIAAMTILGAVVLTRDNSPGASPADAAAIAHHAVTARQAAAQAAWVYPAPEATRAAIREIVALERTPAHASALARSQSEALRDHFAAQLAGLGQRYWDDPKTRPFARDFYAQTLMFRPDHGPALQRGNFTLGQLAQLRDQAESSGFSPEQLAAVAPLRILADPDDPRLAALLASLPAECDTPLSQQDPPARGSGLLAPPSTPVSAEPPQFAVPPEPPSPTPPPSEPTPAPEPPPQPPAAAPPRNDRPAPFDPSELIEAAENARRRGQDVEAARLFRQALAGAPRDATALAALSDIAFDRGDFLEAADLAAQASRAAPTIGEHHTRLGDAYLKLKRPAETRAEYERALELGDARARRRLELDAPAP